MEERKKPSIIKRIVNYEDLEEKEEAARLENERINDNIINRIIALDEKTNELNTKLDAILFSVNCLLHSVEDSNGSNSKKKKKIDKSIKEDKKVENKANKSTKIESKKD